MAQENIAAHMPILLNFRCLPLCRPSRSLRWRNIYEILWKMRASAWSAHARSSIARFSTARRTSKRSIVSSTVLLALTTVSASNASLATQSHWPGDECAWPWSQRDRPTISMCTQGQRLQTGKREVNGLRPCCEDAPATAAHHRCVLAVPIQLGEQWNGGDLALGELGPADARNGTVPALTAQRPVRCHDEVQPDVVLGNWNLGGVAHL